MDISFEPIRLRARFVTSLIAVLVCAGVGTGQTPKMTNIAVLPLAAQGVDSASAQVLTDALSDELLNSGTIRVMERNQMSEILKEQGFQQSGSCDQSDCAVQVGRMLGIEKIVVGSLGKFGSTYTLTVRGVNVGTGEVESSVRRMQKGEMDAILTELLPSVALELSRQLTNPRSKEKSKSDTSGMVATAPEPETTVAKPAQPVIVAPVPVVSEPRSRWGWWAAGAVVVAGGATAAVLLSSGNSGSGTTPESVTTLQTIKVVQP